MSKIPEAVLLAQRSRVNYERSSAHMDRSELSHDFLFKISLARRFAEQTLLVLGAGASDIFAQRMRERGVRAWSLNPNWGNAAFRDLHMPNANSHQLVAAIAEQLPFADNTFDGVLASFSVPRYLPKRKDHYDAAFRETQRVLTREGVAFMAPLAASVLPSDEAFLSDSLDRSVGEGHWKIVNPDSRTLCIVKHPEQFAAESLATHLAALDDPRVGLHPVEEVWYKAGQPWQGPEGTGV